MSPCAVRQTVLLLHLGCFEVEDAVEIDGAGAILGDADLGGRRGGGHAAGEVVGLLARLEEASQWNLHFAAGRQDLALIGRDQLLKPGFLEPHVVEDPAVVQDVPPEAGR